MRGKIYLSGSSSRNYVTDVPEVTIYREYNLIDVVLCGTNQVRSGQKILNKRLVNDVLFATSEGASNAIVATDLPPSVTVAVPICWPALTGAAIEAGRL